MTGTGNDAAACRAGILRWIFCGWLLVLPAGTLAQQTRDAEHPQGKWEVLAKCRLTTNSVADGDSFRASGGGRRHGGREV